MLPKFAQHDLTMDVFSDSRMNQFHSGRAAMDIGTLMNSLVY